MASELPRTPLLGTSVNKPFELCLAWRVSPDLAQEVAQYRDLVRHPIEAPVRIPDGEADLQPDPVVGDEPVDVVRGVPLPDRLVVVRHGRERRGGGGADDPGPPRPRGLDHPEFVAPVASGPLEFETGGPRQEGEIFPIGCPSQHLVRAIDKDRPNSHRGSSFLLYRARCPTSAPTRGLSAALSRPDVLDTRQFPFPLHLDAPWFHGR